MISKVTYIGGLRTEATHLKSGSTIITDAPTDNEGKGEAFSPTDLTSTSYASCMLTIMGIAARNHGIDMQGTTAEVDKIMASDPRRIKEIHIRISMPDKPYTEKEKKILQAAADCTPVGMSLSDNTLRTHRITWA